MNQAGKSQLILRVFNKGHWGPASIIREEAKYPYFKRIMGVFGKEIHLGLAKGGGKTIGLRFAFPGRG